MIAARKSKIMYIHYTILHAEGIIMNSKTPRKLTLKFLYPDIIILGAGIV
jgi:hypothetical protein